VHLGGGDIGFSSGSQVGEAMTIVAAGSQGAKQVPMAAYHSDKVLQYSAESAVISTYCSVARYRTTVLKYFVTMAALPKSPWGILCSHRWWRAE